MSQQLDAAPKGLIEIGLSQLGSFLGLEIGLHENGPPSFWCKPTANQLQTNRKPIRKSLAPKPFGPLARETGSGRTAGEARKPKGQLVGKRCPLIFLTQRRTDRQRRPERRK
jgi:hypothetical protein